MSGLVEALRLCERQDQYYVYYSKHISHHAHQAADRIEALERENARLREALFRADREANGKRKDKAARISAICRQALTDTGARP